MFLYNLTPYIGRKKPHSNFVVQTTGGAVGGATGGAAGGTAGGAAGAGAAGAGGAAAGAAAAPGAAAAGTGLATTGAGLTTAAGTAAEMSWVPENINSKGLCYTAWKYSYFGTTSVPLPTPAPATVCWNTCKQ